MEVPINPSELIIHVSSFAKWPFFSLETIGWWA